jgi:nucleotide-binding universal stress UspA family protein
MSTPFLRPLVPYDGSETADAALTYATDLARDGAALTVVSVVDELPLIAQTSATIAPLDPGPMLEALENDAKIELEKAKTRCGGAGVAIDCRVIHDRSVAGIVASAQQAKADVIIMGTHGRDGLSRTLLGSVTEGVLRACDIPVLTVNQTIAPEHAHAAFRRLVVAVDDSEPADAALDAAIVLAARTQAHVTICSVIDTRALFDRAGTYGYDPAPMLAEMHAATDAHLANILAQLDRRGVTLETVVVEGEPASALVAAAASAQADLLVIGSHGRRGLRRFFLGSVAENVVRHSPTPVLVVRTHTAVAAHRERSNVRELVPHRA